MGAARREPRGVEITESVGKLLPVLYTPSHGKRGKYWPFRPKLDFKIEHTGTALLKWQDCARPCEGTQEVRPQGRPSRASVLQEIISTASQYVFGRCFAENWVVLEL